MKRLFPLFLLLFTLSCANKQIKIVDEEHKTFYVNGISALDGYEAVSNSLKKLGFKIDKDGVVECDLTSLGNDLTYYATYNADKLTKKQASKLTYGLFDNLPSGNTLDGKGEWRIFLQWYKSGEISDCLIGFKEGSPIPDVDKIEVNKRLSALFPHSKIAQQKYGYYYDDNGIEIYYTNGITLDVRKDYREAYY